MKQINVYIDGMPLIDSHMSGIGYTAFSTVNALLNNEEAQKQYLFNIVISSGKKHLLNRWGFKSDRYRVVEIPLPQKVFNALFYYNLLPPLDMLIGKGIYLFFNFKNWPLSKHSQCITYVHDMAFKVFPESLKPNLRTLMNRGLPIWMKRSDKIVVVSEHAASEVHRFYPQVKKIAVIQNGVDHSVYYAYTSAEVQQNCLAYDLQQPYFLYVGNIEPRKNITRLLEAYALFCSSHQQQIDLVIVGGKGWKNDTVYNQIATLNRNKKRVKMIEAYVSDRDLALFYNGAVALLHPALYEGFGLTPLQAMACGTTVVVGRTSSLPEVAGESGIYCDPNDVNDIKKAIEKSLEVKENEAFKNALKQQAALFSWETSAQKLLALIQSVS